MAQEIIISHNDDGIRLERFFQNQFPQVPMSMRQKFFREKKIAVFRSGARLKLEKSLSLQANDCVKIFFRVEEFGEKKEEVRTLNFNAILSHPKLRKIKILWEDDTMMIVEKPAGVSVHPGSGVRHGHSLIDYCIALQKQKDSSVPEPKLIHRLDKNTSGLVMVGKSDAMVRKMVNALQEGSITKKYWALVRGKFDTQKGTITDKIERKETSKYNKISISSEGKDSVTHYEVKKYYSGLNASLLEVTLETGRMHQIRVHFASNGHPLAGDDVYGDFAWNKILQKQFGLDRQFLHAFFLSFVHPVTQKPIQVLSELSEDLQQIIL